MRMQTRLGLLRMEQMWSNPAFGSNSYFQIIVK